MPQKVHNFPRSLHNHQGSFFQIFQTFLGHVLHLDIAYLLRTFRTFSSLIYFCTSGWCSRRSAFSQDIYLSTRAVFLGYSRHPVSTFSIFIFNISNIQPSIFLCTSGWCCRSFTFAGTFTQAWGLFFWSFCTFPGHVLYLFQTFQKFSPQFICAHSADTLEVLHFPRTLTQMPELSFFRYSMHSRDMYYIWHIYLDISDIQPPIYLCTSTRYSRRSTISRKFTQTPKLFFFQIFHTFLGHVLYLFQTFQTFSPQFICAHSADASEDLHFLRKFTWASGLFSLDFSHISRTCISFILVI